MRVSTPTLGLIALGGLSLGLAWFASTRPVDFQIYHRVAAQVLRGDYELYPAAVFDGTARGDSHEYQYAPLVAFIFAPLGLLSMQAAAFLFACLKIPAYAYMGWVIVRSLHVETRYATLLWIALVVAGGYIVEEFRNGNVHAFAGLLMLVAFDQSERRRIAVPACALGLAIVVKLTPLALLGYFALRRRFMLCAATLVVVGVLLFLPSLVVGLDLNVHLMEGFVRSAQGMLDESDNVSLRGALMRALPRSETGVWVVWIALLLVLGGAIAAVLWKETEDSRVRLLEFCLVLTAMLVASPHTQRMHLSTLVVPSAVLIGIVLTRPAMRGAGLVRAALIVTAAASTVLPLVLGSRQASLAYQAWSPYTIAALLLLVVLLILVAQGKGDQGRLKAAPTSRA
jgi:alpha-1,2-mannosyltransferase